VRGFLFIIGIYNGMKYILSQSQFSNLQESLLNEAPSSIKGCRVFKNKDLKEFCDASEKLISSELDSYTPKMEHLLKKYFTSDDRIKTIEMEKLSEESPIVANGFKQIDDVVNLLNKNCPSAKSIGEGLKKKWLSEYNVYFKDSGNNYHLLNRLDTNYTAMAVLITTYYQKLIEQVRSWTGKKMTPSSLFVRDWVDHFFNPSIPLIDPRKNWERDMTGISKELETLPHPISVFNMVLKPTDFALEDSDFHRNFMSALEDVRNKGFKTEDIFEKRKQYYEQSKLIISGEISPENLFLFLKENNVI